jgi:hypothetical protein
MTVRLTAAIAATTSLLLVSTTAAVADPGPALAGGGLPAASLDEIHPLAVPGSTPERRAALAQLGPDARERAEAAVTRALADPALAARLRAAVPSPAEVAPAWQDVVAGAVAPTGETLRYSSRPVAPVAGTAQFDADADGLDDGFESAVADAFTPGYFPSAGELGGVGFARFADEPNQRTVQVLPPTQPISHYRVQPLGFGTVNGQQVSVLRLDYLTLWNFDTGLDITSFCRADLSLLLGLVGLGVSLVLEGQEAHEFDNERSAALVAAPVPAPGAFNTNPAAYSAYSYYTAGHEGSNWTDTSRYVVPSQPVPAGNHLLLALSRSKHATYPFNPDFYPLLRPDLIAAVYAAIDFLFISGQIDELTYLILLGIADSVFFACVVEHFTDQGGFFAGTRINVGEPGRPINGSSFIADLDLAPKLTVPLW